MPSSPHPILIVGAGPTGLILALWLQALQCPFRIIDRALESGQTSRALVVHARTLEYYAQLGIADSLISKGTKVERTSIRQRGVVKGSIPLGDMGAGLSRFPFALSVPQDVHEDILEKKLEERGKAVERGVELAGAEEVDGGVKVQLKKVESGEEEEIMASYVAGCDGAHSVVRKLTGTQMIGGTYAKRFYVADVDAEGDFADSKDLNICFTGQDFCLFIPLQQRHGGVRLVGIVPDEFSDSQEVQFDDVRPYVKAGTNLDVSRVGWFATYKVHHRVAENFRKGRLFLVGDAAHLHSPVGGQGMNTGLGDASNLAWKLASVVKGEAPSTLLDSYEPERIAFAKLLVNTTDRVFTLLTSSGMLGNFIRSFFMPYVWPVLFSIPAISEVGFKRISQIEIQYRHGDLSEGSAGYVYGGDRLPWVPLEDGSDNQSVLNTIGWQVHVYGSSTESLRKTLEARSIPLHAFPWTKAVETTGLERDAIYLVRPDGHVGLACAGSDIESLERYLDRLRDT